MIILSILLIMLLLLAAIIVVECVFKPKWNWLWNVGLVVFILALGSFGATMIANNVCDAQVADLKAEAADINLYYNLVNASYDEYVRFDFYQRVNDYNTAYAACQENAKNPWINVFYDKNWENEIAPIEFFLRTDAEDVSNDYEDVYSDEVSEEDTVG